MFSGRRDGPASMEAELDTGESPSRGSLCWVTARDRGGGPPLAGPLDTDLIQMPAVPRTPVWPVSSGSPLHRPGSVSTEQEAQAPGLFLPGALSEPPIPGKVPEALPWTSRGRPHIVTQRKGETRGY